MKDFKFHESSVTNFSNSKGSAVIELNDVSHKNSTVNVRIEVEELTSIFIDSEPSNIVTMAASDGEVLSLELSNAKLFALIEWNDFPNGESFTHSYDISGVTVKVSVV